MTRNTEKSKIEKINLVINEIVLAEKIINILIYKFQEEQIEKDKRKYALPRILPLGRDRFYNKYYYTDCIGVAVGEKYGTGRIFVASKSHFPDLKISRLKKL